MNNSNTFLFFKVMSRKVCFLKKYIKEITVEFYEASVVSCTRVKKDNYLFCKRDWFLS